MGSLFNLQGLRAWDRNWASDHVSGFRVYGRRRLIDIH